MAKVIEIEVGAELAVDAPQNIKVELRGYPGTVVIGALDDLYVLLQVDADQQRTIFASLVMHYLQQLVRRIRRKISDSRPREIHHIAYWHDLRIG